MHSQDWSREIDSRLFVIGKINIVINHVCYLDFQIIYLNVRIQSEGMIHEGIRQY